MKKIVVLVVLAIGVFFWYQQRQKTEYLRVVETPGESDWKDTHRFITAPKRKGVNPDDPVTTIKWSAFKAEDHTAPPLVLSIKREQWLKIEGSEAVYEDSIGPTALSLQMNWPLREELEGRDLDKEPPTFIFSRIPEKKRRPPTIKSKGIIDGIVFTSPADTPPEDVILVRCEYSACLMYFEYQGRPVEISFGAHRQKDWQTGYEEALRVLLSITAS